MTGSPVSDRNPWMEPDDVLVSAFRYGAVMVTPPDGRDLLVPLAGAVRAAQAAVERGGRVHFASDGDAPLVDQVRTALHAAVPKVWDLGAVLPVKPTEGRTMLMTYAQTGPTENLVDLLERGMDPNQASDAGLTALHYAAEDGPAEHVDVLVGAGADVEARDGRGFTPLITAAVFGNLDVAERLLDCGADPDGVRPDGAGSLAAALHGNRSDLVELLLARGADPNRRTDTGFTALHYAATYADRRCVELLLSTGVDPGARSEDGRTPLDCALAYGNTEVVDPLRAADPSADSGTHPNTAPTPVQEPADLPAAKRRWWRRGSTGR